MRKLFVFFLCCFTLTAVAQFEVGHRQQTFVDPTRSNRNVTTEIYYPASTAGNNVAIAGGQFPVLIFAHGFVMTWSAYDIFWNNIVPEGYIMIFLTTETSFSPSHLDFGKDIAFVNKAIKAEGMNSASPFYGAVGTASAAMGHSMGGGASFLSIQFDSSITALATFAAANTTPSSINAATSIAIPSLVMAAANDCVAPPAQHQIPMYDSLASSCKSYISITGGSHCQFASYNFYCSFGENTCTPQPTITATAQQNTIFTILVPWLDFQLKKKCASGTLFQTLIATGAGITSRQNCYLTCATVQEEEPKLEVTLIASPAALKTTLYLNRPLKNGVITIYNRLGQVMQQIKSSTEQTVVIPTGNFTDGIYYLQLSEGHSSMVARKFLVLN